MSSRKRAVMWGGLLGIVGLAFALAQAWTSDSDVTRVLTVGMSATSFAAVAVIMHRLVKRVGASDAPREPRPANRFKTSSIALGFAIALFLSRTPELEPVVFGALGAAFVSVALAIWPVVDLLPERRRAQPN